MPEVPERIEIEVQPGTLFVRHARCSAGCDLMDSAVLIHGRPSIHLVHRRAGSEGHIWLDSFYGRHENAVEGDLPDGAVVELSCFRCGVSLQAPGERCGMCSAPMFVLHLPHGGFVEGCQRKGCFQHRLRLVSEEEAMQQLFDRLATDNYL